MAKDVGPSVDRPSARVPEAGQLFLSFLPQPLARALLAGRSASDYAERFHAAVLFVDISGFTPLSEALGATGRRGTEELTDIVNRCFEPMIELVERHGGIVGKFGGDALTALFPLTARTRAGAARRALACAVALRDAIGQHGRLPTSAGEFALGVKVGAALGRVLSLVVGDPKIRLEHVYAGATLDRAGEAERRASVGDVVAHVEIVQAAGGVDGERLMGDFVRVTTAPVPLAGARRRRHSGDGDCVAAIAPFLHPSLIERLRAGQLRFVNEHRKVTVVFGRLPPFAGVSEENGTNQLRAYGAEVVRTVDKYGGFLRQIHMGDKGGVYIALFGAPIAHENDEERAARCALDLQGLATGGTAIGVNTGLLFCGCVGSESRREYAVIGDVINVAARLMQRAVPGETLVSVATREPVADRFDWDELKLLRLKGKARPLAAYRLTGRAVSVAAVQEFPTQTPLIGRERELQSLRGFVTEARAGRGGAVVVTGEPGVGKSRLVLELSRLAREQELGVYAATCEPFGTAAPYLPWRGVCRDLFELSSEWPIARQLERLQGAVAALGSAALERVPLLGAVLNLPIEENELTATLAPEVRAESRHGLLVSWLRHRARRAPFLVVLEDWHWADESSRDLLASFARTAAAEAVLVAVTSRSAQSDDASVAGLAEFRLQPLAAEAAERLVQEAVRSLSGEARTISSELSRRVVERSGGNPFYVEELVRYVDEASPSHDVRWAAGDTLPDNIQGVIMARIDALGESEKVTLRAASVLGRSFKARWLFGSYPTLGSREELVAHLETLSGLGLTPLQSAEPELQYAFRHASTQEVAYESLAYATREELHDTFAAYLERVDDADSLVDLLAYHYGRSRNHGKQRVYFRRAGDSAKAAYANESAIELLGRLVPLLAGGERADALCDLGDVLQHVGRWNEAEESLREALAIAQESRDVERLARSQAGLGHLLSHSRSYGEAVHWLELARTGFASAGRTRDLRRVLEHLSLTLFWDSRYERAAATAREAMRLAQDRSDPAGLSTANEILGLVRWHQGVHDAARTLLASALELAREVAYRPGVIAAGNDLAGLLAERGDYGAAIGFLDEARAAADEIGDRRAAAIIAANTGELRRFRGEHAEALECYAHALELALEMGDARGIMNRVGNIGLIWEEEGRHADASRLVNLSVALARGLDDRWNLSFFVLASARLAAQEGKHVEAVGLASEALALGREVAFHEVASGAETLGIRERLAARELGHKEAVAELLSLLARVTEDGDRADVLFELASIGHGSRAAEEAAQLYEELYRSTPRAHFRRRYTDLTGKSLPDPPPLSAPLAAPREAAREIDELVAAVERSARTLEATAMVRKGSPRPAGR